jgi:NAD(P)-dependent dehydrogenase (short-subunit alcohol dehydrogenase family)
MSTVLVVGANRGIGLALAELYAARGANVIGTCRDPTPEARALGIELVERVDVTSESGRASIVSALGNRALDVIILAAGILESDSIETLEASAILRHLEVNAIAPIALAHALLPRMHRGTKIALLTSRMGSIADNGSGGYYAYRMSKAALNAAGRSLAIDLAPRGIHVAILHPGFVRTRMTGKQGLVDASDSAKMLAARIDALDAATSGTFLHADGSVLPW